MRRTRTRATCAAEAPSLQSSGSSHRATPKASYAAALAARPVWLFSRGPVGEPAKPADNPVDVSTILQSTKARDHQVFTGKLVKKHLSFPDRVIASAIRVQEGDFRNWDDIRGWATSIVGTLLAS
jgi:menaquinone-dependent protoporphyrinogen oxidase